MIISVAGILFGLTFAALTYVLQNGFKSFKFSRIMFLKLYLLFSRIILVSLSYLIIAPFYNLYYSELIDLNIIIYIVFSGLFIKTVLDYHAYRGYIETLFSHKLVPQHYGRGRAYFRKISNLGFFSIIILILQIFILVFYPVINSYINNKNALVNESTFVISTGFLLVYSIISIAFFIPGFFKLTIVEYESKNNIEKMNDFQELDFNKEKEQEILIGLLKSRGIDLENHTCYKL